MLLRALRHDGSMYRFVGMVYEMGRPFSSTNLLVEAVDVASALF